jgi:hypothetical protein
MITISVESLEGAMIYQIEIIFSVANSSINLITMSAYKVVISSSSYRIVLRIVQLPYLKVP